MIYNSTILLKGVQKPIFASKVNAESIDQNWRNEKIDKGYIFKMGNISFTKGDIKFVEVRNDTVGGKEKDLEMVNFYLEEKRNRDARLKLSPHDRAKNTDFFFMLYMSSCLERPTEEIYAKVREVQEDFFRMNPKRTVCDFNVLKLFLKVNERARKNHFANGGLRLAEKAIFRDMQLAGQVK